MECPGEFPLRKPPPPLPLAPPRRQPFHLALRLRPLWTKQEKDEYPGREPRVSELQKMLAKRLAARPKAVRELYG